MAAHEPVPARAPPPPEGREDRTEVTVTIKGTVLPIPYVTGVEALLGRRGIGDEAGARDAINKPSERKEESQLALQSASTDHAQYQRRFRQESLDVPAPVRASPNSARRLPARGQR